MKKIFNLFLTLIMCTGLCAQQSDGKLVKEVNETIKQECKRVVDAFTYHVGFIADKNNSDAVKEEHIKTALDYFVGSGDGIYETNEKGEPTIVNGSYVYKVTPPRIEITSLYRKETKKPYIGVYLRSLMDLDYTELTITASDCYFVGDIKSGIDENEYEATISYGQTMIGKKGEWVFYRDYTKKTVRMHIYRQIYGEGKERWVILMGDIIANETRLYE